MSRPKLTFVTGNAQKLKDARHFLGDAFDIESKDLDIPEIQGTVEEVAKDKCRRAADIVSFPSPPLELPRVVFKRSVAVHIIRC